MVKAKDLTGQVFGEWVVLYRDIEPQPVGRHWMCECSCGKRKFFNVARSTISAVITNKIWKEDVE